MIMAICRAFLCVAVVAAGAVAGSAHGQPVVQERLSRIDWERALSDARQATLTPTLKTFRERNETELSTIKVPVLVADPAVINAAPRLGGQGNSYAVAYALPSAKLSVLGTSVFL